MRKLLSYITPPPSWRVTVIVAMGVIAGLFFFLFYVSNASSYLSDKPETCMNCHIMAPQYATWSHSSHREKTNCNDCHVPQDNVFNKYFFKAKDGMRHASIFTLRAEPQVIIIKEEGKHAVHQNCIRCHNGLILDKRRTMQHSNVNKHRRDRDCIECHREVPHGRVNSLSSVPFARVPLLNSPVPKWLDAMMRK